MNSPFLDGANLIFASIVIDLGVHCFVLAAQLILEFPLFIVNLKNLFSSGKKYNIFKSKSDPITFVIEEKSKLINRNLNNNTSVT
jgi:hypothetical protein